ncbi:UNVERIFIED_CONTAM: protein ENHANCED DISEASE RESISTANCE 2-like [Sesamum latifolium]|uniref:Protein ENHANCED DISEASE RESISTANCE 2-like n=1 Tax=Sesamum latifolium TaxID=2727402 RepID=A0AAW2XDF4_9LAMI
MAEIERKMNGWLYLMRNNRFGLQYSRKRYFTLEDNCLKSFKSIPASETEEPVRSAIIDSCIRVVDNGRETHHRKLFFTFTLYNTSNHNDRLKLGVTSSEEAARWIHALQDTALNPGKDVMSDSIRKWQPFSMSVKRRSSNKSSGVNWTAASSLHVNAMTSDVIAPSPWKIFGCRDGLRLFKEAKDRDSNGRLDIDVGSSTVARGVVSLVLGYLNNLVIEMAFMIQGNTADELPEFLLGTCRLNNLDVSKSVCTDSMRMS